jgi:hypothetical protein
MYNIHHCRSTYCIAECNFRLYVNPLALELNAQSDVREIRIEMRAA